MATPSYNLSLLPSRMGLQSKSFPFYKTEAGRLRRRLVCMEFLLSNFSSLFSHRHHQLLVHGSHRSLWCCQHWLGSQSCGDWLLAWAGPAASEVHSDGHPVVEEPPVSGIFNSSSTPSWDSDSVGQIFTSFPGDADADSPVTTFWETLSKRAHEAKKKKMCKYILNQLYWDTVCPKENVPISGVLSDKCSCPCHQCQTR